MTVKGVYYGSIGPLLFDNADLYPDGKPFEEVHEFDLPIEPSSAATKEYVDRVMEDHLLATNPHPQYQQLEDYFPSDHERRGRLFEVDTRHNPRIEENR